MDVKDYGHTLDGGRNAFNRRVRRECAERAEKISEFFLLSVILAVSGRKIASRKSDHNSKSNKKKTEQECRSQTYTRRAG
jgi:hypothetical protein